MDAAAGGGALMTRRRNIRRCYRERPEKLSDDLELLMRTFAAKSDRAQRNTAEAYFHGVSEGLNAAWKLVFGYASCKTLKDED